MVEESNYLALNTITFKHYVAKQASPVAALGMNLLIFLLVFSVLKIKIEFHSAFLNLEFFYV